MCLIKRYTKRKSSHICIIYYIYIFLNLILVLDKWLNESQHTIYICKFKIIGVQLHFIINSTYLFTRYNYYYFLFKIV